MSNIETGGPAFPGTRVVRQPAQPPITYYYGGMTLRDYFAAKVMRLIDANPLETEDAAYARAASEAYKIADAMLKAREKQ